MHDQHTHLDHFRDRFVFPDPNLVYLDGNSLGRLPKATAELSRQVVDVEWGDRLIRSWNERWLDTHHRIGDKLGRLLGAAPGEVAVADSTSVNLFKLVVAALQARPGRTRIITDDLNFPSDHYILDGIVDFSGAGHRVDIVASPDGIHGPADEIIARLDDDVALVTLSHVTYTSGYRYDMAAINAAAHAVGALVLWDLSHAVGAVPIDLAAAGADLAVGCSYKYVNGGPGAPAFLYVRADLHTTLQQPITGWYGHARPFSFSPDFEPSGDIDRFFTGTPPMLSLALIEPGVDVLIEAGMDDLRAKSVTLTQRLIDRCATDLAPLGFSLRTPADPQWRGSHVSLAHPDALGIDLALIEEFGIVPDFRPPDHLRIGIAPLYTRFADVDTTVEALVRIIAEGRHTRYAGASPTVV